MSSRSPGWLRLRLDVLVATILSGCSPLVVVNALVPSKGYELTSGIGYGGHHRQRLDVYRPSGLSAAPAVVFFYGGAWQAGDRGDYRFVGQALASEGFLVVIPDYRVYPPDVFPAFVEDAAAAVRWVHEHAEDFGGDPRRVVLMGHSAGAHIAVLLAADAEYLEAAGVPSETLRGVVGLAGPYDFLPLRSATMKAVFGPAEGWERSQPIRFVDGDEPPMLLVTGDADTRVDPGNTRRLAARLREHGGAVEEIVYPGVGHTRVIAAFAKPLRRLGCVHRDTTAFIRAATAAEGEPSSQPVKRTSALLH